MTDLEDGGPLASEQGRLSRMPVAQDMIRACSWQPTWNRVMTTGRAAIPPVR
jgi:hypothetical protein